MNNRELFYATLQRENGDLLLHIEQGFNISYDQWTQQGLPETIKVTAGPCLGPETTLFDHFNVAGFLYCRFDQFCIPQFERYVLKEESDTCTEVNDKGVTVTVKTQGYGSPPHEIDFTIKTQRDYQSHRHRFVGNIDQRVNWDSLKKDAPAVRDQSDYPVALWVHGPFAFLREFLGTENAMLVQYTEPEHVRMMLADHLETSKAAAAPVIKTFRPDCCFVWEDCCGSSGPFMAPDKFQELFAPWYRAWKDYLLSMGVPWIVLDTDGEPSPLVRLWYENGVDCMLPWEVNSVDMLKFAEEFPQFVMCGGIYKHIFEPNDLTQVGRFKSTNLFAVIDGELERVVKPMVQRGGYIAALDHWAFWGTTYEGYRYYSEQLTRKFGKANNVRRFNVQMALKEIVYDTLDSMEVI